MTCIRALRERLASRNSESGEALILALVFLLIFSLLTVALLSGVNVNLNMTAVTKDQSQLQYAADAGVEWGIHQLQQSGSTCNSGSPVTGTSFYPVLDNTGSNANGAAPFSITNSVNNQSITTTVYCQPVSGLGKGTFGPYTVVTGMNYPNNPHYPLYSATAPSSSGSQEYAGTQTCTSLSGDPIGSGSASYATQVGGTSKNQPYCVSYPSGVTPTWIDTNFSPDDPTGAAVTPATIQQIDAVDATDIYAVGAATSLLQDCAPSTCTASIVKNSTTITSTTLFTGSANYNGYTIAGTGIANGTTLSNENNATNTATLSSSATQTNTTDTVTLTASKDGIYGFDGGDDFGYLGESTSTTPVQLNGVWAPTSDPNDVWAVGNSGTILYCGSTCNSDTSTWTTQRTGTTNLNAITGSDTSHLWAVGASGKILSCVSACASAASGTATTANGSTTLTSSLFTGAANFVGYTVNMSVGGIPTGTTITAENNGSGTATMSNAATALNTNQPVILNHWASTASFPTTAVTGSATEVNTSTTITSTTLFTGSANYVNWVVTGHGIPGGTVTIKSEDNTAHTAVLSAAANQNGSQTLTLTPPAAPTFNSVYVDSSLNVWAAGTNSGGTAGVIYECPASSTPSCDSSPTSWTLISGIPSTSSYASITGNGSSMWAVGTSTIGVCSSGCTTGSNWSTVTEAGDTLTYVVAGDATDVWAVGFKAGANPTPVLLYYCTGVAPSCPSSGTWTSQAVNDWESSFNTVTAVPALLRTDQTTWGGSVWTAGAIPGAPPNGSTQSQGTGWATYFSSLPTNNFLLDMKGGGILNGGMLNAVTPMKVDGGSFVQYMSNGTCPPQPVGLQINNGGAHPYQCASVMSDPLLNPLLSVDEPLPSESAMPGTANSSSSSTTLTSSTLFTGTANYVADTVKGTGIPANTTIVAENNTGSTVNGLAAHSVTLSNVASYTTGGVTLTGLANCVAAATCTSQSGTAVTVTPNNGTCASFTEFFPGYYGAAPKPTTTAATSYFASGVYYIAGGGSGALDSGQTVGKADGTVTNGTMTISDPDGLFTGKVGWTVTDEDGYVGSNAAIQSVSGSTATLNVASTIPGGGSVTNDVFTIANPSFLIGGQPGPGDTATVAINSPCWSYISSHGAQLDSPAGFNSLTICGAGHSACAWPSNTWYEGGGAVNTPNGTGVTWILGSGTWFDVHTVDWEMFTRQVPAATLSPSDANYSSAQIEAQVANEGTQGLSIREVPPTCPTSSPPAGATLGSDGAFHPGPYCVTTASKWLPLNPGANSQALQIDANNHVPYVYIHGAIYMPDNDMTLFTNQPQRDVWVGALDLNSAELTYDTSKAPPIQIIGGGPQPVQDEIVAEAQNASSGTKVWEEALINLPSGTASTTNTLKTLTSSTFFSGSASYVGYTVTGGGIPANTIITAENNTGATVNGLTAHSATMSNAATATTSNETVTLTPQNSTINGTASTTNTSSTLVSSTLFFGSASYVGYTVTGGGIPANTIITAENNTGATVNGLTAHSATMSNAATSTTANEAVTITPSPISSWRYCNGFPSGPNPFVTACSS